LKIVAADSSAAILNDSFEPLSIVAVASVLVTPPYRESSTVLAEPIFANAGNGHEVIVHEAELCKELLGKVKADSVHLDMSLGAIPLEQLSPFQLSDLRISARAKRDLLKILPKLRKIAGEITQKYGVEVLAIGKESIPVRIAELTAGAHAILYACEKVIKDEQTVLLGLPSKCQPRVAGKRVYLYSLIEAEHDIRGYAEDAGEILKKVNVTEMLNPCARGFRTLRIIPRSPNRKG
jgi:nitrogenase molybdenum-iron protein alpha/beta subunit